MPLPSRAWSLAAATSLLAILLAVVAGPAAAEDAPAGWKVVERSVLTRTAEVTIAMVVPKGSTPSFDKAAAEQSLREVAAYYRGQTDGRMTIRHERTYDWMWSDTDTPCSWTGDLHQWASRKTGWWGGEGRHLVLMVPTNGSCPNWANGEQNWWVGAGGRTFQPGTSPELLMHELGHNFSLPHASSVQCDDTWDFSTRHTGADLPERCQRDEYGNMQDFMGGSWNLVEPINSAYLDKMQMLPRYYEPQCGAERRLTTTAIDDGAATRRVVSWTHPADPGVRYWADYRSGWRAGVQVLRNDPQYGPGVTVLSRPSDTSDRRQLLKAGEQVALGGGVRLRLERIAADQRTADLSVFVPCPAGAGPATTTLAATAATGSAAHGSTVRVDVQVLSGTGTPGGQVAVMLDDEALVSGTLSGGRASLLVPTGRLRVGGNALSVAYAGSTDHGSSAQALQLEVTRATTATRLDVTSPGRRGGGAVATATVTRSVAGPLPAAVRLVLQRGGRQVVARTVDLVDGSATWSLPRLGRGTHRVVAIVPDTVTTAGSRASDDVRR